MIFFIIASANMEVDGMGDELTKLKEDYQLQKESLDSALSKLQITEQKLQQVINKLFTFSLTIYILIY